jgi:hypothetical protein
MAVDPEVAAGFQTAARRAVGLVCVSLPHLSGLAHMVRIAADDRVATAGVFPSGRLLVDAPWFLGLTDAGRAFVLAHELLHLALHAHTRTGGADPAKFNVAHDLIINDMLETELGIPPPGGGLRRPGARHLSAEALMMDPSLAAADRPDTALGAAMREALARRGDDSAAAPLEVALDDVLDEQLEAEWFPEETPRARATATASIERAATKALSLQRIQQRARDAAEKASEHAASLSGWGVDRFGSAYVDALDLTYRAPWQLALHRWLDAVTIPERTYRRASRPGADHSDVALPGRVRDAQTISIVLDSSGSMTGDIAHALGSIMAFGRGANIETVRIVQCDTAVTSDDVVAIDDLASYRVSGFGGSDMTPAMVHLAQDPETTAVVVITDGGINYPAEPMPYQVLWVVYGSYRFAPGYGQVIHTDATSQADWGEFR